VAAATAAAERDADVLRAVIDIRTAEADDPDGSASDAAYAAAFQDDELDVDRLGPDAVGARIRARPADVARAMVAALDSWAVRRRTARPRDKAGWGRVVDAARAEDPDPARDRMRSLWAKTDREARRGAILELARQADLRTWPPASALLLARAQDGAGELDAAVGVLRHAQAHHPGDVWLDYELARALERSRPPRTEEAIGYYTAARALRPETGHQLAHLLDGRGRGEEASSVFADLVRLRPGDGRHWACYGRMLAHRGDRAGAATALDAAAAALREEIRSRPDAVTARSTLGDILMARGELDRAIAAYREAIRLRPDVVQAHCHLGNALRLQGKLAEAIAECCEAIRVDPDHAGAHVNLAIALSDQGKVREAIPEFREAIRLRPDDAAAHCNLGSTLCLLGKGSEAIVELREAIRLNPEFAAAHKGLGVALSEHGKLSEAISEFREAIRLQPEFAEAHYSFGIVLGEQGKVSEAIAAYREAIRLQPELAEAHCNLGHFLQRGGRLQEALSESRKGHALGSKRRGWPYPSAEWIRQVEEMVALEARLPTVLRGEDRPKDADEGASLAHVAYLTKRYRDSAWLYADALRAGPALAEDRKSGHRYDAACAAALAGAGRGESRPPPDEAERARWRRQAVAWLAADLSVWSQRIEGGRPEARAAANRTLRHWKHDADLAGIRDPDALDDLPLEERRECRELWSKVDALLGP
jgi:tetratricopeptide (TPR) repeat protein